MMCGIFGYIGNLNAIEILEKGLKNLLYRGYDSYGFAVFNEKEILSYKKSGSFENLEENVKKSLKGKIGIAHTRWATKGEVDEKNAHPHFGCRMKYRDGIYQSDIAIVHNGQITNYLKIRSLLEDRGYHLLTENDSELIVHFIAWKLRQGFSLSEALHASVNELDGPFAYIISTPTELGMARDKLGLRPLVVGEYDGTFIAASEEIAVRKALPKASIHYLKPGGILVWKLKKKQ